MDERNEAACDFHLSDLERATKIVPQYISNFATRSMCGKLVLPTED
jgi:hypothetical protein